MFVDETDIDTTPDTPTEEPTDSGDPTAGDELTVDIDGQEYSFEATNDLDGDGDGDAVIERTDDGAVAFIDTDDDGRADVMVQTDTSGTVTYAAEYDASSGDWAEADVADHEHDLDSAGAGAGSSADDNAEGTITVHTQGGAMNVGPAEYDMNSDGVNDTAVVTAQDGSTQVFVDTDGDGDADESVIIGNDGSVVVAQDVSDGEWQVVQTGHLTEDGSIELDEPAASGDDSEWSQAR